MLSTPVRILCSHFARHPKIISNLSHTFPSPFPLRRSYQIRMMASVNDSIPHIVRTAGDQRQRELYDANIGRVEQINRKIRLIRLYLAPDTPPLRHLPGQYIDLSIPNIDTVGGFTITSPPQTALRLPAPTPSRTTPPSAATFDDPYIELAIQDSPNNPPAAYLWRPPEEIMNAPVQLRIGGNFTYPPLTLAKHEFENIDNIVFVAGGVGINPIVSMISAMDIQGAQRLGGMLERVRILYTSRREVSESDNETRQQVLFENRLQSLANKWTERQDVDFKYTFFETSGQSPGTGSKEAASENIQYRRISHSDLLEALGKETGRPTTLVYICGLPTMTDEYVDYLSSVPGMDTKRVLCEKWW